MPKKRAIGEPKVDRRLIANTRQTKPRGSAFDLMPWQGLPRRQYERYDVGKFEQSGLTASQLLSLLPDLSSDVGLAVWNFLRLAGSDIIITVKDAQGQDDEAGNAYLTDVFGRINAASGGLRGLISQWLLSGFLQGAVCGEIELAEGLREVADVHAVDPATIAYTRNENQRLVMWQQESGVGAGQKIGPLDPEKVIYVPIDPWIDDPYGRPPASPVLQEVWFDVSLMLGLRKVVHNQGWPRIHIKILEEAMMAAAPESLKRDPANLAEWLNDRLSEVQEAYNNLAEDEIRGVGKVSVEFGRVAENAVNATYQRVYQDGLTLSDRIWRFEATTQQDIADRVVQAVADGSSAKDLARNIRSYLRDPEGANARYNAMRLARTELSTAAREGHVRSATKSGGTLKDHILAMGWRLSASHPRPDICEVWAFQDLHGLGAGNYLPESVPVDHPQGLCYQVSVLKSRPDLQFVVKEPMPVTSWPPSDDDLIKAGQPSDKGDSDPEEESTHEVDSMIRGLHKLGVKPTKEQRHRIREHVAQAEFRKPSGKLRKRQSRNEQWVGASAEEFADNARQLARTGKMAIGLYKGTTTLYASAAITAVAEPWRSVKRPGDSVWLMYSAQRGKIVSLYQAKKSKVNLPEGLQWWR